MRFIHTCLVSALVGLAALGHAAHAAPSAVIINNVHIFDGQSITRAKTLSNVLIVGDTIQAISTGPLAAPAGAEVTRIEGGGRTLMPGLIDAHWHAMLIAQNLPNTMLSDLGYLNLRAAQVAEATLMRGFTTVRDMGGPVQGLRRAIEERRFPGPRIYPSGAMISQTGGHGDFRLPHEIPRAPNQALSHTEVTRTAAIADGADQVLLRAREQLMLGATQIKLMAGGGVTSLYDPLDASQYTLEEIRAAVAAAENWGTYVAVHAYTSRAVQVAIEAGVKVVEHGQLIDEETAKIMAAKGIWWSLQPFIADENAKSDDAADDGHGHSHGKRSMVAAGTDRAFALARKHNIKVAFGTDILFTGDMGEGQSKRLLAMQRWYSPGEVLRLATGQNGQLLALTGERNPYRKPLGVVANGAYADLLLVEGDPTTDLSLLGDPAKNLKVIMKNGRIYKNQLK